MLRFENNVIKFDEKIVNSVTKLVMKADVDLDFFAILETADKIKHVYPFTKFNDVYKANLIIDATMVNGLLESKFYIVSAGEFRQTSNKIKLEFDMQAIKNSLQKEFADKYLDLQIQIKALEKRFNDLTSGKLLKSLNITNTGYIKKGMIPVAVDDNGNFVCQFVFKDHVHKVNGKIAEDGEIVLSASDILIEDKSIESVIKDLTAAVKQIHNQIKIVGENQKEIQKKLGDLTIEFTKHISNGII